MNAFTARSLRAIGALSLAAAGVASIVASGGGDGGSPAPSYIPITALNALDVSSAMVQAVGLAFDVGEAGGGPITPQGAAGEVAAAAGPLLKRAVSLSPRMRILAQSARPLAEFGPDTEQCDISGDVTLSGNRADPSTISVGDRITAAFNDCDDGDGYVFDGRLELIFRDIQGDPIFTEVYRLTLDVTMTSLRITEETSTFTADGEFMLDLNSLNPPVFKTYLGGSRLQISENGETYELRNFEQAIEVNGDTLLAVVPRAIGTLVIEALGGRVDYEATAPVQIIAENNPYTGEILVTGDENSTVTVLVIDTANVQLKVDENGDNVVDEFIDTTWEELNGDAPP